MSYVEGFVIAVPIANKAAFIEHAELIDRIFMDNGAIRVVECWGEDVPHGKQTDFYGAVKAGEDEAVVFSWVEWPDKATRDSNMARMKKLMESDPRFDPRTNPPPFDAARMIYGGFESVVIMGE
jgi:uncharacterized protein YbaA (DUF1428 family)